MALGIVYYLLCILGILKKRSKLLSVLMMVIMWLVFGLATYNGDYGNYSWIYQNIQNPGYWMEFEPLYNVLMYVCSVAGLNFIQFRMVFGFIYIVLLYYVIGKYTENRAEVLGLYMLFPFLSFTSVIRSGFAGVIVVLAYHEIIGGKNNGVKFWILMILATLIQYTSIFFSFYFFLRREAFKRNIVMLVGFIVLVAFVMYYTGLIYRFVSLLTSSNRLLTWFVPGGSAQQPRWILYLIMIDILLVYLAFISKRENIKLTDSRISNNSYADDIFHISVAMLIFIPTFFVTNASARFLWQILLLIIIGYAKDEECAFTTGGFEFIRYEKKTVVLLVMLILFSVYANLPYRGTENDGRLVFQNNLIYGEYVSPSEGK